MNGKVTLDDFCKDIKLEKIYYQSTELNLVNSGINRPGLQLHGYYEHFDSYRVQVIGKVEVSYLLDLEPEERNRKIDDFFSYEFPCF
ncbi:MAG: HPr(Ser) kinase/phosphatase, partial [Acetobacterium sp.]|nr:HPr(Ser) kinase/phosphatase [Acetobacterium sp.]